MLFRSIREAVEKRDMAMFAAESKKVIASLDAGTAKLQAATALAK